MNNIITLRARVFRGIARNELAGRWLQVAFACLLFEIFTSFIPYLLNVFVPFGRFTREIEGIVYQGSTISSFYEFFIVGVFSIGLCSFFLQVLRKHDTNPGYLFDPFSYYLKAFSLTIVMVVKVFLWALLFVIPGIIALYRYAMAPYILAEDPSKGVMQCIEESKFLMNGNKMNLFVLHLTFILWGIAANIPGGIAQNLSARGSVVGSVIFTILNCVTLAFYVAYVRMTETVYFDVLTGHLRIKTDSPSASGAYNGSVF